MNRAESEAIAASLIDAGWQPSASATCDLAILNTCTVTAEADAKCRKALRALIRDDPARIVVTGCAVRVSPDAWSDIDGRITSAARTDDIGAVARIIEGKAPANAQPAGHGTENEALPDGQPAAHAEETSPPHAASDGSPAGPSDRTPAARPAGNEGAALHATRDPKVFRTRADVKIQDGCDHAGTYCIVHIARGPARSVCEDDVIRAVANLAKAGTPEVVLVGIDIGAYDGRARTTPLPSGPHDSREGTCGSETVPHATCDLATLCTHLLEETDIPRLRLSSLEPESVTHELLDVIASSEGRICRHLHLCLQSGSDKVLSEMARPYTAGEFVSLVKEARERIAGLALSTDVIVGFPGEKDNDFRATCEVVEECGFMKAHVFSYSKRTGTPAAARADQVPPDIAAARSRELVALAGRLAEVDARSRVGNTELVVVERGGRGTSESYHSVVFDDEVKEGELVEARLASWDAEGRAFRGIPLC